MEVINSFFNNIKDKLTNPFFGTLIIVLLIHHWELFYGLFNFDDDCTYDEKILFIHNYISVKITLKSFLIDAFQALIYMFFGYLIIVLTRSIVLWIEYWLMPFITGKVVNKNVVKRTLYDEILNENKEYFDQHEDQRENVRKFSKIIDDHVEQIKEKDKLLIKQSNDITNTLATLESTQSDLKFVKNQNELNDSTNRENIREYSEMLKFSTLRLNLYKELFYGKKNDFFFSSMKNFPPTIIEKIVELKNDNKWEDFLKLSSYVYGYSESLSDNIALYMKETGLALLNDKQKVVLTPIGEYIYIFKESIKI